MRCWVAGLSDCCIPQGCISWVVGGRVVFFPSSSFLFFLSLLAWLPFCCVAATQQPSNPTSQQHNNPTSQQPNIPTTQQPNNPTTQQPNKQPSNTTIQQTKNNSTTQQANNNPITHNPFPKKLPVKPFFNQIDCLSRFFRLQLLSFFFTIFNHFGELWGASGVLWGPILGVKIEKNRVGDAKCSQVGSKSGFPQCDYPLGDHFWAPLGFPKSTKNRPVDSQNGQVTFFHRFLRRSCFGTVF